MTSFAASELSLIEGLEQQLRTNISLSLLADVERELLRLRTELSSAEWLNFCEAFPHRELYRLLNLQASTKRRPASADAVVLPTDVLEINSADRPQQITNAWENSLPCSRSARARRAYFAREIAEVIRTMVTPRILILGGRWRELGDALHSDVASQVQFVAVTPDTAGITLPGGLAHHDQIRVETGTWSHLPRLRSRLGEFDLIYSPGWLDGCEDRQASGWLNAGAALLRSGGRLIAANFAPGSRDAGWMEACWNWRPCYRSEEQLAGLAVTLEAARLKGHTICRDESGASAFLEIYSA